MWDSELGLVYYNWRHYNTLDGRWNGRDKKEGKCLYAYTDNLPIVRWDKLGLDWIDDISNSANRLFAECKKTAAKVIEDACKLDKEYRLSSRVLGAAICVTGYAEATTGLGLICAPEPTMVSKIAGAGLTIHGADTFCTGIRIIYTGELQPTLTNQAIEYSLKENGVETNTAKSIANATELTIGVLLARTTIPAKSGSPKCIQAESISVTIETTKQNMVQVTRWGGPLEDKKWVMLGKPNVTNYILSGKVQPSILGNIYAKPWQYKTYYVPKNTLERPGIFKSILGQRIYHSPKN